MWARNRLKQLTLIVALLALPAAVQAQNKKMEHLPSTANRPMHGESAQQHEGPPPPEIEPTGVPEGMTLDEVLDRAAQTPPDSWDDPIPDDGIYAFSMFEQLEYRIADDQTPNHFGWEGQGWIGRDIDKFWWKTEGESVFEGRDAGESETELLYSRLITPFWNLQFGGQYANNWSPGDYDDRVYAVVALQGMAPFKFELGPSFYLSEHGDLSAELEAEYDIRITQRLVLQPRAELTFFAQDIADENIGAGLSDVTLDLRLRYEIKRTFAPYVGVRYHFLTGETDNLAEAAGEDTEQIYLLTGLRIAF